MVALRTLGVVCIVSATGLAHLVITLIILTMHAIAACGIAQMRDCPECGIAQNAAYALNQKSVGEVQALIGINNTY